jgi:hypothetical protein
MLEMIKTSYLFIRNMQFAGRACRACRRRSPPVASFCGGGLIYAESNKLNFILNFYIFILLNQGVDCTISHFLGMLKFRRAAAAGHIFHQRTFDLKSPCSSPPFIPQHRISLSNLSF